jgi:cyclohexyl-isocyanide hydratase
MSESRSPRVLTGMVLFENLTQLDLTGPYEVFSRMPNMEVYLISSSLDPVRSDSGLAIVPNICFSETPPLDILFVPGGPGIGNAMEDEAFLLFLREQGRRAKYVTSVCTGSLLLAAAGLLQGYRATTHWLSLELLKMFGIEAVSERVVVDRNRITGGGVTAGIDFGLVIASQLFGEETAKEIQLLLEYDPLPPFKSGSPKSANPALIEKVSAARKKFQDLRRTQIERVISRSRLV